MKVLPAMLRAWFHWAAWSAGILLAILVYARFIEPARLVVETVAVDATGHLDGDHPAIYRMVFISDLEMHQAPGHFERRVQATINDLSPDVVVVGGDLLGGAAETIDPEVIRDVASWLGGFVAPDGVLVTWGEQELLRLPDLQAALPAGVTSLQHRAVMEDLSTGRIRICGPGGIFSQLAVDPSGSGWVRASWGRSLTVAPYLGEREPSWGGVDVTSVIHLHGPGDSLGLAVMETSGRAGYRFRVVPERGEWALIRPGDLEWDGRTRDKTTYVGPRAEYRIRIRVEPEADASRVRSKIWRADDPEPDGWPIDFRDLRPSRPERGTVALLAGVGWTASNRQGWDRVVVRDLSGGELLREEFNDPARFDARWRNPGGRPDLVDATVVVAHNPVLLRDLPAEWRGSLDLVIAGHTHGGQIRLPFFGPAHIDGDLPRSWSAGMTRLAHGRATLYVSRGLGESGLPVRFLCPPEITLVEITLHARRQG
ncbi:MAG: hypothetical protein ACE5IK_07250 [Acidobacteriota bacterium]